MGTFNFDVLKPEPVVTLDTTEPAKTKESDKEDILITGSLSSAYTDALNELFGKPNNVTIISESIAQCTVAIKKYYENKPKPILAYATDVNELTKNNMAVFDDISTGLDSGLFKKCFICIEQNKQKYSEMGYSIESYLIKRGINVYRNKENMLAAIRNTNV